MVSRALHRGRAAAPHHRSLGLRRRAARRRALPRLPRERSAHRLAQRRRQHRSGRGVLSSARRSVPRPPPTRRGHATPDAFVAVITIRTRFDDSGGARASVPAAARRGQPDERQRAWCDLSGVARATRRRCRSAASGGAEAARSGAAASPRRLWSHALQSSVGDPGARLASGRRRLRARRRPRVPQRVRSERQRARGDCVAPAGTEARAPRSFTNRGRRVRTPRGSRSCAGDSLRAARGARRRRAAATCSRGAARCRRDRRAPRRGRRSTGSRRCAGGSTDAAGSPNRRRASARRRRVQQTQAREPRDLRGDAIDLEQLGMRRDRGGAAGTARRSRRRAGRRARLEVAPPIALVRQLALHAQADAADLRAGAGGQRPQQDLPARARERRPRERRRPPRGAPAAAPGVPTPARCRRDTRRSWRAR